MTQYSIGGVNIIPFYGSHCVFSNFYLGELNYNGILFKSSEHAYQYSKCIYFKEKNVGYSILRCDNAYNAKMCVKNIFSKSQMCTWKTISYNIMYQILLAKYKYVPLFRQALIMSKDSKLIEANQWDFYWGCGLSLEDLLLSKTIEHNGNNIMGSLLERIRSENSWDLFVNN